MLTDDEARRLLQRAAETVDVDHVHQVTAPSHRSRWPLVVAVAAVAVVAVVAAVLAHPRSSVTPSGPGEVRVPSVLGYDEAAAARVLDGAGLTVTTRPVETCESGRALGTDPAAGTPVEPGSTVTLLLANGDLGYCAVERVQWQLLAFADGRGDPPPLASSIRISEGDGSADVSAAQATDPETWRACGSADVCTSVLAELREAALGFHPDPAHGGSYLSPTLSASPSLVDGQFAIGCRYDGPESGADYTRVGVTIAEDGCPEIVLDVYRARGAITEVVLRHLVLDTKGPTQDSGIGPAFVEFARGGDLPPLADQVDFYLGNAFTGALGPSRARDRAAWATCTEAGSYAARTCPISPLAILRGHARVDFADRPAGLCMPTYGPLPARLRELDRVVVVPRPGSIDMCGSNFAIQLFTDDGGRLVAVSTLLGEP